MLHSFIIIIVRFFGTELSRKLCNMGFPEIVDFARNFSVMVRIQGPDPKGLKMRKHAFHHYNSGNTTLSASGMLLPGFSYYPSRTKEIGNENWDAESVRNSVLVLTVASVIEPFVSKQHKTDIYKDKPQLLFGVQIEILVEGKREIDVEITKGKTSQWIPAELLTMVDIPVSYSAVQSLIETASGSLEHGWEIGWSLASYASVPQSVMGDAQSEVEQSPFQMQGQMRGSESSNPSILAAMTTRMALLHVSKKFCKVLPELNTSPRSQKGDILLAMGSPFGILSPVHFFNSISVGSIANSHPPSSSDRSLLMADIRCLPGMEGSAVFGEHGQVIGILTRPLRQRTSGAEIQLVIPWEAIASACSDLLQEEPQLTWKEISYNHGNLNDVGKMSTEGFAIDRSLKHSHESLLSGSLSPSPVERAISSVCLITIDDGAWASGVLLNKQGLVLTNAHLLEPWRFGKAASSREIDTEKSKLVSFPCEESLFGDVKFNNHWRNKDFLSGGMKNEDSSRGDEQGRSIFKVTKSISRKSIRIRLDHRDPWLWVDARVVYVSKGPLDVALLQLEFVPNQLHPITVEFKCPLPGSKAYVIGHGLFGPRCEFLPSACLGVISKVVEAKNELHHQFSLDTNMDGQFPAMLETTAAVHPGGSGGAIVDSDGHMIGLVTSNARHGGGAVIPHLNFSIPCAPLEPVFKFSQDMQDLSLLDDLDRPNEHLSAIWALMPPLSPKPDPSLPSLPKLQIGDNEKDMKGSRFAKFIADRHNLLKDQSGKVEHLSNKFIPSKL
ncbi:glyoxysomal processing protease, glyoxysomal-like [Coffea arabica]|uniref:Glyoxysomal processing protease, glyoxysomal-like n=1 Tax=Coffea arabica TaxID=13443 RepID=A0ABM4WFA5_COFAR|nr:glyoxysomal processing protease, glyoxysomal [Coffea arabica]XP_027105315.1 glyoxysomal processing protease, glyoxysomal [Coffea arabica]XP_027105316.1 glyoxysomal processing protease, glyoxysomal [Coffea arabica]